MCVCEERVGWYLGEWREGGSVNESCEKTDLVREREREAVGV